MSQIQVIDVSFSYDDCTEMVLEHVNCRMDTDWKLGVIGRNGRGKTTFLRLLQGHYAYTGKICASVSFEYFPYEVSEWEKNTLSVLQEIVPARMEWEIERELSLLEIKEDVLYRPFATLSEGEQNKCLLAALFLKENRFLLIDEPTNHLDEAARESIGKYLRKKKGFLLVSHDRALLDACADHILSFNRTNIEIQQGNFSSWQENRRKWEHFEGIQNEKLKKEIRRLKEASKQTAVWSEKVEQCKYGHENSGSKVDRGYIGHKAAKMMKRSKSLETRRNAALEEKSKLLQNIETEEALAMAPIVHYSERLVELRDVSLFYGEKKVRGDVGFSIHRGERIALCGKNGSGKSSILKLICGEDISHTGEIFRVGGLKISRVAQDTSFLRGTLKEYAKRLQIEEAVLKSTLRKMGFDRAQLEQEIFHYSEGQKKKVLLAGSLCEKAHLYIWDEPLNFIDVISRVQIEEALQRYQPTMLFVEHDATFREKIATRQIRLDRNRNDE